MSKINTPSELPDCQLINTLVEKANLKTDYDFNYVFYLDEVRKIVSIQVSQINILFPEYTPHDSNYHLNRLFFVADHFLGKVLIESMNVTELFLLCVSLYAHDWGMAVSEDEKNFIISGCADGITEYAVLDYEVKRFSEFCKAKKINAESISNDDWQEYVRITHAFRSGKRIRTFFEKISSGIGEFASRISEGHWLDFDVIDNHISYPVHAPIHLDTVNVKALTIYVRLIDLLDIGEDRTPYVLWKFVAPRNEVSKLEWNKHRALLPVTFPSYQDGRYIQVNGSTDDHNVYASLMDLKNYINDQFRQSLDILSRLNHSYHKLNISHINWEIAARNFEPVLIQFQFDRNRMFEILSDQIYQGNPYVFIRELIQNSIDAIHMREEVYRKSEMFFNPKLEVIINEDENNYIVEVIDNGIGMDQYIIKNYLAVAGKSYYRSKDFQKEGLNMDAISRFGIGVLSCFMLSDYIEIKTFRDPNISTKQEHLKIVIPAKENYFRIEKDVEKYEIGTAFKVLVNKSILPLEKNSDIPIKLSFTSYLKRIAGFVKYPIKVTESDEITVITTPYTDSSPAFLHHSLNYDFPFDKAIFPQDISLSKKYFVEKQINLNTDLKLADYEGCITYLMPKDENIDVMNIGHSWPTRSVCVIDFQAEVIEENKIEWFEDWIPRGYRSAIDSYLIKETSYSIFIDGLLLPNVSAPIFYLKEDLLDDNLRFTESFISPNIVANIPKNKDLIIDLARTKITSGEKWDLPIWEALLKYIKGEVINGLNDYSSKRKILSLAKIITYYGIPSKHIIKSLSSDFLIPIPMIGSSGVTFNEYKFNDLPLTLTTLPKELFEDAILLLQSEYLSSKPYNGILLKYIGSESILSDNRGFYYSSN